MFYTFNIRKVHKLVTPITIILLTILFGILIFNLRFPLKYYDIIQKYSNLYGVDPVIVSSIINVESGFNKNAVSPAGASGLMQIMEPTAEWAAQEIGMENFNFNNMIFDPDINIKIGTWYIDRLISQFGDLSVALAAYNAGSGNVSKWLLDPQCSNDGTCLNYIPFGETNSYVRKVDFNMRVYNLILRRK